MNYALMNLLKLQSIRLGLRKGYHKSPSHSKRVVATLVVLYVVAKKLAWRISGSLRNSFSLKDCMPSNQVCENYDLPAIGFKLPKSIIASIILAGIILINPFGLFESHATNLSIQLFAGQKNEIISEKGVTNYGLISGVVIMPNTLTDTDFKSYETYYDSEKMENVSNNSGEFTRVPAHQNNDVIRSGPFWGTEYEIADDSFKYGKWYASSYDYAKEQNPACPVSENSGKCKMLGFVPNGVEIEKLEVGEIVTSKFEATYSSQVTSITVTIYRVGAIANWEVGITTDEEGHAVVEVESGSTNDDLEAIMKVGKPAGGSWFTFNSSVEYVNGAGTNADFGKPDNASYQDLRDALPTGYDRVGSFFYGARNYSYGYWVLDDTKLMFRPNVASMPVGTEVISVLGLNLIHWKEGKLGTYYFRVTLRKVDPIILSWLDSDNGSDIVANSNISTYRFGVMRSKPNGFATFDTSVSEVGANGNDTNNDDKLDANTHMKGNFIDTEPMAGEEYEFATNFKYGKWYRRHIITIGSSSNPYCPATWYCVFFAFEPDADESKRFQWVNR